MPKNNSYGAKDIEVLEGLQPVRKRPGMYIGNTNQEGLHHLVNEILDNSIDEVVAGFAKNIDFYYNKNNSITIKDDKLINFTYIILEDIIELNEVIFKFYMSKL